MGIRTEDYLPDGMFSAVCLFVCHNRVKLSTAERGLVDAQVRPYVLREHPPLLGVKALCRVLPLIVAAQMALVLTLKQITVYIKEPFKRAARNRVSVQAYLLKKPQTLSRSGSLRQPSPSVG